MHISCSKLSKKFAKREVVKGIDLNIKPGQVLALLGPNGAGKSTTIKMLTGQLKPCSGIVTVDGQEYKVFPDSIRHALGVMPQEIIVWDDLTIKENLEYSGRLYKLSKATLNNRIAKIIEDLKLEPELNTLARNLSGGYKRRLNLAISIVHDPKVIFLDEPSPGIDAQSRLLLTEYIAKLAKEEDRAVVLTDHYLDEAEKLADYVVIIDEGKVVTEGTVEQLKVKHGNGNLLQIHLNPETSRKLLQTPETLLAYFESEFESPALNKETLTMLVKDPAKSLNKALNIIDKYNLQILNINLKESSLEDIFLLITGRGVRE